MTHDAISKEWIQENAQQEEGHEIGVGWESWPVPDQPLRIVCAAVQAQDGEVVIGIRHFSPDMKAVINKQYNPKKFRFHSVQGFVDQYGQFWDRYEAWKIAEKAGQIFRRVGGDDSKGGKLCSENLY